MRRSLLLVTALSMSASVAVAHDRIMLDATHFISPDDALCERYPEGSVFCGPDHAVKLQSVTQRIASDRYPVLSEAHKGYVRDPAIRDPYPTSGLPDDSGPGGFLFAAAMAVRAHDAGTALEALERATTRTLDRSVPLGATNTPEQGNLVELIGRARTAVEQRDWNTASATLDKTMHHHDSQDWRLVR